MRCGRLLLIVVLFIALAPLAFSQESLMILDHEELGKHQRPLVEFDHEKHVSKVDCLQCHHDYDAYLNNRGGEGQPCGTCHGPVATRDAISLKDAFHAQCKGCHEIMIQASKPSGPVTCGGCHVRK